MHSQCADFTDFKKRLCNIADKFVVYLSIRGLVRKNAFLIRTEKMRLAWDTLCDQTLLSIVIILWWFAQVHVGLISISKPLTP